MAAAQGGLITRAQLRACGVGWHTERYRVRHERWQQVANGILATFTGELTSSQRLWLGVLHGRPDALVGGVAAATLAGLKGWSRDVTTILVPYSRSDPDPLEGFAFVRTRRPWGLLRSSADGVPRCRLEPAVLLFASRERYLRTADGILMAAVQQRLTTPDRLIRWIDDLPRLRRAPHFREVLTEAAGGAQSVAELDVARMCRAHGLAQPSRQVKRRDASGKLRFTDCEWRLPDGRTLVLEVDGAFHMDVEHWEDDLARQRALTSPDRHVVRCTARELRDDPDRVALDLLRLGVPRAA